MRTIAHTLLLLVVLLQFGAVIPPVCATREREEQGPLQEGDARESDGLAGHWLSGTKPGPEAQGRVDRSGNELLLLCAVAG